MPTSAQLEYQRLQKRMHELVDEHPEVMQQEVFCNARPNSQVLSNVLHALAESPSQHTVAQVANANYLQEVKDQLPDLQLSIQQLQDAQLVKQLTTPTGSDSQHNFLSPKTMQQAQQVYMQNKDRLYTADESETLNQIQQRGQQLLILQGILSNIAAPNSSRSMPSANSNKEESLYHSTAQLLKKYDVFNAGLLQDHGASLGLQPPGKSVEFGAPKSLGTANVDTNQVKLSHDLAICLS